MITLLRGAAAYGLILVLAGVARSGELIVDQKNPRADDKNPGTEARPFKTIQAGVDMAKVGDTIYVKEGDYEEMVVINKPGNFYRPTILTAWKDDHVRIGYRPRPLPVAGKWEPVPGSKSWKVQLTKEVPDDFLVLVNQAHIVTFMQDSPVKEKEVNRAAYRKSDRTLWFNANGKDPSALGTFEYGRRPSSQSFFRVESPASGWVIRKIEFSFENMGMYMMGDNCTVEDCFFTRCYRGGIFLHGRTETVRRCCFYRCGGGIFGGGVAYLLEDNIIVECGQRAENDTLVVDIPGVAAEDSGPTVFKGTSMGMNFLYNIVSDNPQGAGWYADCPDSQSSRIVGNAFWDNLGGGIYNEACVADTITQGNMFFRNGISSSVCARWNVIDNLFFESGVIWYNMDLNAIRDTYNLLRGNAFINPRYGYLSDFTAGVRTAWPEVFRGCMVDHNRIWAGPESLLINDGGEAKKYRSIEDIRKEFGWEIHGKVQPYDSAKDTVESVAQAMGGSIVTFRIPWGKHSGEARPMLANAHALSRWPGAPISVGQGEVPTFFWRVADGNYDPSMLWNGDGPLVFHQFWLPTCGCEIGDIAQPPRGYCWYVDAEPKYPDKVEDKMTGRKGQLQQWNMRVNYAGGKFWLVAKGSDPQKMLPQGVGYWSPCLGAAPGARITISLNMRGKGLVSTEKGSPAVWLQFTSATGQNRTRAFLVGRDDLLTFRLVKQRLSIVQVDRQAGLYKEAA